MMFEKTNKKKKTFFSLWHKFVGPVVFDGILGDVSLTGSLESTILIKTASLIVF